MQRSERIPEYGIGGCSILVEEHDLARTRQILIEADGAFNQEELARLSLQAAQRARVTARQAPGKGKGRGAGLVDCCGASASQGALSVDSGLKGYLAVRLRLTLWVRRRVCFRRRAARPTHSRWSRCPTEQLEMVWSTAECRSTCRRGHLERDWGGSDAPGAGRRALSGSCCASRLPRASSARCYARASP